LVFGGFSRVSLCLLDGSLDAEHAAVEIDISPF
jgi:hypothetical protein